jgi:DNA-binding NtrC family response regulator
MTGPLAADPLVLIVEDDDAIAHALVRYLDAAGYRTARVSTASEAIHGLERLAPDVVITDIFLADGNGYEVISAARASRPELPVIAVSGGRAGHDVLAQAAKLGADATIEKPFSYAYLVDTIDRCLDPKAR